jgi:DNA-binding NarL/FixJ family response regulator
MPKTVVIADDHAFTVSGMRAAVAAMVDFEVVAVAANGIEAIALIKRHQPDCAILDLSMPGANGLEAMIEAKRWSPRTRFAVITGNRSDALFVQLVDAGVSGIFLKSASPDSLCDGIRRIVAGGRVIPSDIASLAGGDAGRTQLTAREIEVLQAIARGNSNVQIAGLLGISPKTVDSHRTTLMRKMDVHSTATLLVRAMREGLIDP